MNRHSLRRAYNRWSMSLTLALVLVFPAVPFIPLPVIADAEARAGRPAHRATPARRTARSAHRTTRRRHHHRHHHVGAAVVTGLAIGTVVASRPPRCTTVIGGGVTYHHCDGVYYAPRYQGTTLVYVVVAAP